jgi:hypothetical protein
MEEALESKNIVGFSILNVGLKELYKKENEINDKQDELFNDISNFYLYLQSVRSHINNEDLFKLLAASEDFFDPLM